MGQSRIRYVPLCLFRHSGDICELTFLFLFFQLSDIRTSLIDTVASQQKRASLKSKSETTGSPLSWSTLTATKQLRYEAYGSK